MERYIAVDNVCAWPNLTQMKDGLIVALIFNQPTHGGWEGDVECWGSTDEGRLWQLRGVATKHEPGTNRMNVAAGLAGNGDLISLISGWSKRNAIGNYSPPGEGEVLPVWVCRSADGGTSWHREGEVVLTENSQRFIPFGDIVQLPDGMLGACLYQTPRQDRSLFFTSADDGLTWHMRGLIGSGNESNPLVLPDGRLLAALRTVGDQHLELYESGDAGASWRCINPQLTLGMQHPAHLATLADGRLLLCYGLRNSGLFGIGARLSDDSGRTWQPPIVLADFQTATDGGYPSSVQSSDGTIITAYYANNTPAHNRYHMGVIRWKPQ